MSKHVIENTEDERDEENWNSSWNLSKYEIGNIKIRGRIRVQLWRLFFPFFFFDFLIRPVNFFRIFFVL